MKLSHTILRKTLAMILLIMGLSLWQMGTRMLEVLKASLEKKKELELKNRTV